MAEARKSRGPVIWLTVVLAALAAGGYLLWTQDTRRGGVHPEYSIHRTDDRGAAVVYRLYESSALRPQVWDQEFTKLREPGLLILLAPARKQGLGGTQGDILPPEVKALDDWVKQGNVVVVMSRDNNPLFQGIGLIADDPEAKGAATSAEPVQPSLLAYGVKELQTQVLFGFKFGRKKDPIAAQLGTDPGPQPITAIPPEEWVPLFVKRSGPRSVPQVVTAARGRGLYVAVNDVGPAGNLGIAQGDNAQFMLNLARLKPAGGTLWFDEYHKRNVDRGLIAYLRERSFLPALAYGMLLLLLLFWRTGTRFGAPEPLVADTRRDSIEYLRAVAALYRNARMGREALATVYADFQRRVMGPRRADAQLSLDELGRRYELRTGRSALEARKVVIEAEAALARAELDEDVALEYVSRLTRLDEALRDCAKTGRNG